MSPDNSPSRIPSDQDSDAADDNEILLEEELDIIEIASDQELNLDDTEEMPYAAPIPDDSKMVLKKHQESVFCLDVHPHGRLLVTGSQENTAIVWDLTTASDIFTCTGHEDSVTCVAFSPSNGQFLATGDMAGKLQIWRLELSISSSSSSSSSSALTNVIIHLHQSFSLSDLLWLRWWQQPTSDTTTKKRRTPLVLFAGFEDGLVSASPITTDNNDHPSKYLTGSGSPIIGAVIVPSTYATERPVLAVVGRNGDLRVWDLKTAKTILQATLQVPSSSSRHQQNDNAEIGKDMETEDDGTDELTWGFLCMAGPQPCTSGTSNIVDIVAVAGYELIVFVPCGLPPLEEIDNGPKRLSPSTFTHVSLEGAGTVEAMEFCWTHAYLAFGTVTGQVGVYDTSCMRMRNLWTYSDPTTGTTEGFGITALKWSRSNSLCFFTSTLAATVVCWSAASGCGTPLATWRGHSEAILDIALGPPVGQPPHEAFIASASDDATVRIYDLAVVTNAVS